MYQAVVLDMLKERVKSYIEDRVNKIENKATISS